MEYPIGTASSSGGPMYGSSYHDQIDPFRDQSRPPSTDPFSSRPPTRPASSTASSAQQSQVNRYFHSRRIKKEDAQKPWLEKKDPKEKWVTIIPLIGLAIGFTIAGLLVYDGIRSVVHHNYCPILSDDFSRGLDPMIWTKEAEVGGFGNGQFEETTITDENVYVKDGKLVIQPTLQDARLIETDTVRNLTAERICSSDLLQNCVSITNLTTGTIMQPVRSGRINTKLGAKIRYGRVEVTATLPAGDWLWPAIWMLPVESKYGMWPRSGEIDIAESRGNNYTHKQGGNNIISSALHWGPNSQNDAWWRTNMKRAALHTTYAKREHKFGLEWSQKYLFTYIDSRLLQVLYTDFAEPLWKRGNFPLTDANGTRIVDMWSQTGAASTPFDQDFYLVLNVAVGGTNGWFADGVGGKPWVNESPNAKKDFWDARDTWYPTWQDGGRMTISKVEMWQQCDGNE